MTISKQAKGMAEENNLSEDINQAYIDLVGEEYATAEDCADNYEGEFNDSEEFAQNMAENLGYLDKDLSWPYNCIDWEKASYELMFDYMEQDGYYFRNS